MVKIRYFNSGSPLRVRIVLFVPIMSDHAALSRLTARPGDLHSFGGQPAKHGSGEGSAVRSVRDLRGRHRFPATAYLL